MYKQHVLNQVIHEMKICQRLYTKIPLDKMHLRPKEDMRNFEELLQYISIVGTALPWFWTRESEPDFWKYFARISDPALRIMHHQFLDTMDRQIELVTELFNEMKEEDFFQREVEYPWGGKAALGEAIIATSVKFLTGYKLQLFLMIRMCSDEKLGTADAWFKSVME